MIGVYVHFFCAPTQPGKAVETAQRYARRFAATCNEACPAKGCTVGNLPCPFLLAEKFAQHGKGCSDITAEDWLECLCLDKE